MEGRTLATRVILIRHGESTYNAERRIQGRSDKSELTQTGRAMARQVGEAVSGASLDFLYHSPLQRAAQTADIVAATWQQANDKSLPMQVSDDLREVDLPLWENMRREEVKETFPEEYRSWQERPHEFFMTLAGGEKHYPVLSLCEQAKRFWQDMLLQQQGKTVAIVAHNGIIRCLLTTALGIEPSCYQSIQQSNCNINVLNFAGGWGDRVQLESMNLVMHLGAPFPSLRPDFQGVRLFLVRHGETQWNRDGRFQGQIDVPLNDNGRAQSARAGELLKDATFDFAVSSSMLRPKETAEIILKQHPGVPLELRDELREISHGLWEGKLEAEIQADYSELLQTWKVAPETVQMPEGENLQQVWDRAIAAWMSVVERERETARSQGKSRCGLVVGHDAINKAILCHLFDFQPDRFWTFKQGNGAITIIDYDSKTEKRPILQMLNLTATGGIFDRTAAGAL